MKHVVILDDDPDNLSALSLVFEQRWEASSINVSDPTDAVRICRAEASWLDLLVCDIDLRAPLTGIEAALQVLRSCPGLPILIASATGLERLDQVDFEKLRLLLGERVAFLEKPFTADRLLAAADNLVEGGDARAQFVRDFYLAKACRRGRRIMPQANPLTALLETTQGR
jgi:CheY-like chemotaxis protein